MRAFYGFFIILLNFYSIKCYSYDNIIQSYMKRSSQQSESEDADQYLQLRDYTNNYDLLKNSFNDSVNGLKDLDALLPNVSQECLLQTLTIASSLSNKEPWAIQILDSFGKPASGVLRGAVLWNAQYDECLNGVNASLNYYSQYCAFKKPQIAPIKGTNSPTQTLLSSLVIGLCMPDKCSNQDVAELVNFGIDNIPSNIIDKLPFNLTHITEEYITCNVPAKIDTSAIVALTIISILLVFVLAGTVYDLYKYTLIEKSHVICNDYQYKSFTNDDSAKPRNQSINLSDAIGKTEKKASEAAKPESIEKDKEPFIFQILLCFSLYTNLKKLFKINKSGDQLDCVHGIRFLSMGWVVLGHTFAFSGQSASNGLYAYSWVQRFTMSVVDNAYFSVDSFFLLSGLLTSYLFLKEVAKRNNKISSDLMIKFYVHRLWRITPPYMLVVMVSGCLTQYWATGPSYPTQEGLDPNCKANWWTNLLYINNLVNIDKMCFGISWYLSNDMQFHWIAPLFLIPFALGKKFIGLTISILLLIINVVVSILILLAHPGTEIGATDLLYFKIFYVTPWVRIGPFIIGILLGYILFKCKSNPDFKFNNMYNIVGWYLALFSMGLMLFGLWPNFQANPANHLNKTENILYQATSRIIWAIGLGFVIFSCCMNKGGFINDILTWKIWTPLSRLSFAAYLVHLDILYWFIAQQRTQFFFNEINIVT